MVQVRPAGVVPGLFCGMGLGHCKEILAYGRGARFLRHEVLFRQGEPLNQLILIESGQVKVSRVTPGGDEIILWILGPGEAVEARIDLDRYACSATAMEDSSALVWDNHRLLKICEHLPRIRENLGCIVSSRLGELETRFCELARQSARQRLATSLLRLLAQVVPEDCGSFRLRVTQEELGKLTGLTVFTISRLLSSWQLSGTLEQRRASLVIRNISSLEQHAGTST